MFFCARDILNRERMARGGMWRVAHERRGAARSKLDGDSWTDAGALTTGSEETLTSLVTPVRRYLSDEWRKGQKIRGTPSRRRPCKTETVFRSKIIFARSNVIGQQLLRQIIRNPQRTAWTSFGYHALMSWMM